MSKQGVVKYLMKPGLFIMKLKKITGKDGISSTRFLSAMKIF